MFIGFLFLGAEDPWFFFPFVFFFSRKFPRIGRFPGRGGVHLLVNVVFCIPFFTGTPNRWPPAANPSFRRSVLAVSG